MNKIAISVILALGVAAAFTALSCASNNSQDLSQVPPNIQMAWEQWKITYKKQYASVQEQNHRFRNFISTFAYVHKINSDSKSTWKAGLNIFADLDNEEFLRKHTGFRPFEEASSAPAKTQVLSQIPLPSEIDWRTLGAVQAIKNQGACGSCWAFSAISCLESASFLKSNVLPNLSEQQLVDCDKYGFDFGCEGGMPDRAFNYLKNLAGGSVSEAVYPYTAKRGDCLAPITDKKNPKRIVEIDSYGTLSTKTCEGTKATVAVQPLSVAVTATKGWQTYISGIYPGDEECNNATININHAVNIVGYNDNNAVPYWIVRNSWGTS